MLLESELESVESLPVVVVVCVVVVAVLSWDPRRKGLFTFSSATTVATARFAGFSSTALMELSSGFASLFATVLSAVKSFFASTSTEGAGTGTSSDICMGSGCGGTSVAGTDGAFSSGADVAWEFSSDFASFCLAASSFAKLIFRLYAFMLFSGIQNFDLIFE